MHETIEYIDFRASNFHANIGIILGSGLGALAQKSYGVKIPYCDIPSFPSCGVEGHKGELIFDEIASKKVIIMNGRIHYYEGHPIEDVIFPIKVLKKLGVEKLIITNAAGAVNKSLLCGDLMLIKDHINFMGVNPLRGKNDEEYGTRFPDMSEVYSQRLRKIAQKKSQELGMVLKTGVYLAASGPSYETPAEIRAFRKLGVDAVGMSTVPEAIFAKYCGMEILGISAITNLAAGLSDVALSHQEVMSTNEKIKDNFILLIEKIIGSEEF